jgi:hypothetical protein
VQFRVASVKRLWVCAWRRTVLARAIAAAIDKVDQVPESTNFQVGMYRTACSITKVHTWKLREVLLNNSEQNVQRAASWLLPGRG